MDDRYTAPMCLLSFGMVIVVFALSPIVPIIDFTLNTWGSLHFGIFLTTTGTFWVLGVYSRIMDESIDDRDIPDTDSHIDDGLLAKLTPAELLLRSDNLDKVRSNLRTGTSILMGLGSALLLWIASTSIFPLETHFLLLLGSFCLILMAVISILFSFRDPSERSRKIVLREGLVPTNLTKSEYEKQLQLVIGEKEEILSSMRTLISFGLLLFIVSTILAIVAPLYVNTPTMSDEATIEGGVAMMSWLASGITLLASLGRLGYLIIGRHFLGIVGVSSAEFMPTRVSSVPTDD